MMKINVLYKEQHFCKFNLVSLKRFKCLYIIMPKAKKFKLYKTDGGSDEKKQLDLLMQWVTDQVKKNDPPRFSDVTDYAHRILGFTKLKQATITRALRLHSAYQSSAPQQLRRKRWNKFRPIIVKMLGCLHGDIGFFPATREYSTPARYKSGFLVCKDVLSRFTYVAILNKTRDAESMVKAFSNIMEQYKIQNPGHAIVSLAFDKERSVVGNTFQNLLKENNISFHAFQNTSSKSKMAEGEIRIIRNQIRKLRYNKEQRWWHLLQPAVDSLNRQPIRLQNKFLVDPDTGKYFTPAGVNVQNVANFISAIEKAVPAYYFNQFMVDPQLLDFKFKVGSFVRQKLIASSSAVIGEKRSDIALGDTVFVVTRLLAYVSKALTPEKLYIVENVRDSQDKEAFDEDEIAETAVTSEFRPLS